MSNIKSFQRLLVVQALYEISINENRSQTPINEIFANIVEHTDYKKKINNTNLKFAEKIYDRIYIEGFAYGNLLQEPVKEAAKILRQNLAGKPLPKSELFREKIIQVSSGESHVFNRKMQVDNSALVMETQVGQLNPKLQGVLLMIDTLMQPQFYNELRTTQQLGYIVNSGLTLLEETMGLI